MKAERAEADKARPMQYSEARLIKQTQLIRGLLVMISSLLKGLGRPKIAIEIEFEYYPYHK